MKVRATIQIAATATEQPYFATLFIGAVIFFSLFVAPGYDGFTDDIPVILPPLYHALDPSLFPHDLDWFKEIYQNRTLLIDFLAFFVRRGIPIPWVLFLLSALSRLIFFTTLYYIIRTVTNHRVYALFALLFFITGFNIPGTGMLTMEKAFSYRAFAFPLGMLSMAFYLAQKRFLALPPLFASFAIHPITAIPFWLFFYGAIAFDFRRDLPNLQKTKVAIALFVLPLIALGIFFSFKQAGLQENLFTRIDPQWKELARLRNPNAFLAFWDMLSFAALFLWTLMGVGAATKLKDLVPSSEHRRMVVMALLIPAIIFLIAAIGEYFMLHGIVKLALLRSLAFIPIFVGILFGYLVIWHLEHWGNRFIENILLVSIIIWFLFKPQSVFFRDQFLLFVPPLIILLWGILIPIFKRNRFLLVTTATAAFLSEYILMLARTIHHRDFAPFLFFHVIILAGALIAILYQRHVISSSEQFLKYCLVFALPFLVVTSIVGTKKFTIFPYFSTDKAFVETCDWIKNNIGSESIFIVEPFMKRPENFRLACLRQVFVTYKDGGIAPYGRAEAFEWQHREDLVLTLQGNLNDGIKNIQKEYRVDYIFSETPLPLPSIFSNKNYMIYDIR
ncbi:MAG: hypothetical protein A3B99_04845 [Candidatus Yanofskybacteria bacterium RIFCSPHIGHO2_02_FULL_44_12b]|nr:MAG: hypothetical protein A3B99_04845 [Candidatus Yanofskybacteria bacterium RIFCSPHIGHO2_02_FULL_44_12b]